MATKIKTSGISDQAVDQPRLATSVAEAIIPVGAVIPYAGATPPSGYLLCNGSAVSRSTYAALFTAIGTTWGAGDGSTTFNLPDLRGRAAIGAGTGTGLSARALAATGGAESHQLAVTEIPAHGHPYRVSTGVGSASTATGGVMLSTTSSANAAAFSGTPSDASAETIGGTGGGQSHNNMQPFAAVNFLIKT